MSGNTVVFRDATSSLDDLIAQAQEKSVHLMLADVTIEPGHPIEGELAAPAGSYKPWVHDAALDETEELDGTDGDLLIVGALGMGISDEERMGIIGSAVRGEEGGGPTASAQSDRPSEVGAQAVAHELWSQGQTPRWHPKRGEGSRLAKVRARQGRETSLSDRGASQSEETYFATTFHNGATRRRGLRGFRRAPGSSPSTVFGPTA